MSTIIEQKESIKDILILYATALDSKQYEQLKDVFVPDATAIYSSVGECSGLESIQALVSGVLNQCSVTQHILTNFQINVSGNQAQAKCYLQAIHLGKGVYSNELLTIWGEYSDELILTNAGWRITHRQLNGLHSQGDIGLQ